MKTINFYLLHPAAEDAESALKYLGIESLSRSFNFVWDKENPDYLFTTELIYNNPRIRNEYKRLHKIAEIVIFFTREAVTPDFNLCDYAIGFDANLRNGDRYIQLPTAFDLYWAFMDEKFNSISTHDQALQELARKSKFCNFLYSNHMAHPNRDRLFYILSDYKRVDSLGRHLNNTTKSGTGYKGHERDCIKIKSPYKFSIASENATFPGYTSEKILTSLASHTVPIYFGDPNITEIVNPECFLNCNALKDLEEIVELVKRVDEDDDLWSRMISSPWQTPAQAANSEERVKKYKQFFFDIFSKEIADAKRMPEGCRPDMYSYQFFSEKIHEVPLIVRAYRRIMKSYLKR